MLSAVIEDVIKTFMKNPSEEFQRFGFLSLNVFLDEYRKYLLEQRSSFEQLAGLVIVQVSGEIVLSICKQQQKEYFEETIDRDFNNFQRYANNEILFDSLAKGKSLALYTEYRFIILDERNAFISLLAKLGSLVFFFGKTHLMIEESSMSPLDRFLVMLNIFCMITANVINLETSSDKFDFIEKYEEKISKAVLLITENNHIINETGKTESEFERLLTLVKEFSLTSVQNNYYSTSIINSRSRKGVELETAIFAITSFFMKHNDATKIFFATDFPGLLKDLRFAVFYYRNIRLTCRIYEKKFQAMVKREMIPITNGVIFTGKNVTFKLKDDIILDDVSYSFKMGEWVSISGDSGCGKTTLCNIILGKISKIEGDLRFCGEKYNYLNIYEHTSYVSPSGDILSRTVLENCLYGVKDVTTEHISKMNYYLNLFDMRSVDLEMDCTLLSTGEKQRVKIIRLILSDRPIWVLDEITANINATMALRVMSILRKISRTKLVISISHNLAMICKSDRILTIKGGKFR